MKAQCKELGKGHGLDVPHWVNYIAGIDKTIEMWTVKPFLKNGSWESNSYIGHQESVTCDNEAFAQSLFDLLTGGNS